jgi:hypothetical protein
VAEPWMPPRLFGADDGRRKTPEKTATKSEPCEDVLKTSCAAIRYFSVLLPGHISPSFN